MKPLLAFDTATPVASVALWDLDAGKTIVAREAPVKTHGKALVPLINELLNQASARPEDLSAVACGAGPGSFTGVRVGMATAKGLCLALGIPLLLPSSLTGLAMRAPEGPDVVLPCLDAKRNEIYVSALRWTGRLPPETLLPECALNPAKLGTFLASLDSVEVTVLGQGAVRYRDVLADPAQVQGLPVRLTFHENVSPCPDAVALARLGGWMLENGKESDLASAQPTYLRPSDAEAKFNLDLSPR